METQTIVMFINLAIYNVAILKLLTFTLSKIEFRDALSEKDPAVLAAARSAPRAAPPGGGAAPEPTDPTSYSRVSGLIGSVVMAAFFWAIGNVILYKAFSTAGIADIKTLLSSLGTYFLAGSSLFVPYAFNQLKSAFG
jgi:hypothetical protein